MLSVIMLIAIMLSVIMLTVLMLSVVALNIPQFICSKINKLDYSIYAMVNSVENSKCYKHSKDVFLVN
jgi:hypothetical protein